MATFYPELAERVRAQPEQYPDLYGAIDFTRAPYRLLLADDAESALPSWVARREPFLDNEPLVELMSTATYLADAVADSYAALVEHYGVPGLISMLRQACREGIEAVEDAPDELRLFLAAMENTPSWVDRDLVEEGARASRVPAAFLSPFVLRGAFLATFTNTYAALPMTLTGTLSGRRAAHRVHETASFFAVTTLPGALDRHGPGFEAAAMVRLMHSVVRYNALRRSDRWDPTVFGMPIPQVDQMPAGLINMYIISVAALRRGRTEFSRRERAVAEFTRYRCFLLGLPDELLPVTPQGVVDVFHGRAAMLRGGFDDEICGALVRSTMAAYLQPGTSGIEQAAEVVEKAWSAEMFCRAFCDGNRSRAAAMGVQVRVVDRLIVALTAPFVMGRFLGVVLAGRARRLRGLADRYTLRVLKRRLVTYGLPEYRAEVA